MYVLMYISHLIIMFLSFLVLSCERHPHAVWIGCAVKTHQSPRTKTFVRSSPPSPMNENVTAIEGCDQRAEMCQLLNDQVSSVYWLLVTFVAVFCAQGDLSIGSTGPVEKCGFVRYHALSHSATVRAAYWHPFLSELRSLSTLRNWSCLYILAHTKGEINLFLLNF